VRDFVSLLAEKMDRKQYKLEDIQQLLSEEAASDSPAPNVLNSQNSGKEQNLTDDKQEPPAADLRAEQDENQDQ